MSLANSVSMQRLTRLILNESRRHIKGFWLAIAAVTLVFVIKGHQTYSFNTYYAMLFLGGLIYTANAFKDIHDTSRAYLFLMIPCSNLERFLSRWFMTSIGFIILSLFLYMVCVFLSELINYVLRGYDIVLPNVVNSEFLENIGKYFVVQTVFLLGGITFKRYAFIKTFLVSGCVILFVGGLALLMIHYMYCTDC